MTSSPNKHDPPTSKAEYDYDINQNSPEKSVELKRDESPETRIVGTRYNLDESLNNDGKGDYQGVNNDPNPNPNQKPFKIKISKEVYLFVSCAALNSCNLGYDIGVNTSVAKLLTDGDSLGLTERELEIFMGSINLFAAIGAIFASTISDRYGRRGAFIVAAVGFIFGVLLQAVAGSYATLMAGRVFVGLGVGFGLSIDPIYIAEISPSRHRGRLVTWSEMAINVGIVFGFASGLMFYDLEPDLAWRLMFSCGIILPSILIVMVIQIMPESPRWLISNGREDEAKLVLEKVYPVGVNIDDVVKEIKDGIKRETRAENAVGWNLLFFPTPAVRRMLMVGLGSAIAQQLVGIDAVQYFLEFILEEAGVQEGRPRIFTLIGLGILKLVVIIFAGKAFDKRGRRPFLFISLLGIVLSYFVLAFTFGLENPSQSITIIALGAFLAFFSIGMGPVAWLIPAEVFSTVIRAKAMSLATFLNRVTATIVTSTFLTLADLLTYSGFFVVLGLLNLGILVYFHLLLPETKGKSLEDMSVYFAELTGDETVLEAERQLQQCATQEFNTDESNQPSGTLA